MYVMILVIVLNGRQMTTNNILFNSEANCLQAISKSIEIESPYVKIKARCVKQ